jgi:hypothetical protein
MQVAWTRDPLKVGGFVDCEKQTVVFIDAADRGNDVPCP